MKPVLAYTLGGLLVAGTVCLLVCQQRTIGDLQAQAGRLAKRNADLQRALDQASRQAADIEQRAVALDTQLGSAKSRTTATETRHVQLARELNETRNRLTEREQREVELMTELAALREKVARAGEPATSPTSPAAASLASEPAAPPPSAVDSSVAERRITDLEQQLTELLARALAETPQEPETAPEAFQPPPPRVVRVGPHDAFVVIDYGRQRGARPGEILRLARGTAELAQVQISDARPRFSLAQVLPATLKGKLQSGDFVVLEN
jgi:hypothetical protein